MPRCRLCMTARSTCGARRGGARQHNYAGFILHMCSHVLYEQPQECAAPQALTDDRYKHACQRHHCGAAKESAMQHVCAACIAIHVSVCSGPFPAAHLSVSSTIASVDDVCCTLARQTTPAQSCCWRSAGFELSWLDSGLTSLIGLNACTDLGLVARLQA